MTGLRVDVNNILTEVQTYRNDSNGNRLAIEVREYINGDAQTARMTESNQYDLRNQLIETITENGTIVRNTYNVEGYRVKKEVITNEEGKESSYETTRFLYEGDKVILEVDENGNETAYNVYGTNLLARSVGEETYYYLYNGHADVTALINPNGTVAATYYYDAFGNVLESTGEADNPIRYAGYQYDDETGLYYLNARMYDPKLARFLQEDTYTGDPKDPLSLNLYTYCHNNPIMYYDPTGHAAILADPIFWEQAGKAIEYGAKVAIIALSAVFVKKSVSKVKESKSKTYDIYDKNAPIPYLLPAPSQSISGIKNAFESKEEKSDTNSKDAPKPVPVPKNPEKNGVKDEGKIKFPETPEEMDNLLGQEGVRIPDGPSTPGRNKVKWKLPNGIEVTFEQHLYDKGAPDYHTKPHFHVDIPNTPPHIRFEPGSPI